MKNLNKKGQALPLNTIVIAILVIIVLLVIIVFFTSKVGESGNTLDEQNNQFSTCGPDNPAISTIYGDKPQGSFKTERPEDSEINNYVAVPGVPNCWVLKE